MNESESYRKLAVIIIQQRSDTIRAVGGPHEDSCMKEVEAWQSALDALDRNTQKTEKIME